jgi:hypothetical protein
VKHHLRRFSFNIVLGFTLPVILATIVAAAEKKTDDNILPTKRERLIDLDLKTREAKAYRIRENTGVYVVKFDSKTKTYLVRIEGEPAVGPNITTLEWLIEAIDNGSSVKTFKRHPKRLVGGFFKLRKPLWLLTEDELVDRSTKLKN